MVYTLPPWVYTVLPPYPVLHGYVISGARVTEEEALGSRREYSLGGRPRGTFGTLKVLTLVWRDAQSYSVFLRRNG